MENRNNPDTQLFKVMTWSTVFSFAILGAVLGSLEGVGVHPTLVMKPLTIIGAVIGAFLGWAMWTWIRRAASKAGDRE